MKKVNYRFREPKVTILMSVFNGDQWLEESIQSILSQTFTNFEFIVINDGSKDRSLDIIKKHARKDNRIILIDKSNSGLADSLNYGISKARSDWIARIDSDDLSMPDRIQRQYAICKNKPNISLLGAGFIEIDSRGKMGRTFKYPTSHSQLVKRLSSERSVFPHSSAFFKKAIVQKVGGYRIRFKNCQDLDLWFRLSEYGNIGCISEPLVKIRQHEGQKTKLEQGRLSIVFNRIAMISHWLRKNNFPDPVSNVFDDAKFEHFRRWCESRLEIEQEFEYNKFKIDIKSKLCGQPCCSKMLLKISTTAILQRRFALRWFFRKIFGDKFYSRSALEWSRL